MQEIIIGLRKGYEGDDYLDDNELGFKNYTPFKMIGRTYNGKVYTEDCINVKSDDISFSYIKDLSEQIQQNRIYIYDEENAYIYEKGRDEFMIGRKMQKKCKSRLLVGYFHIIDFLEEIQHSRHLLSKIQIPISFYFKTFEIEFNWYGNVYPGRYQGISNNAEFDSIVEEYMFELEKKIIKLMDPSDFFQFDKITDSNENATDIDDNVLNYFKNFISIRIIKVHDEDKEIELSVQSSYVVPRYSYLDFNVHYIYKDFTLVLKVEKDDDNIDFNAIKNGVYYDVIVN